MKIKSLIIEDETGKQYAFTHRSIVEVKEYEPEKDPEVQGTGLIDLQPKVETVEPLKAKKKKAKK